METHLYTHVRTQVGKSIRSYVHVRHEALRHGVDLHLDLPVLLRDRRLRKIRSPRRGKFTALCRKTNAPNGIRFVSVRYARARMTLVALHHPAESDESHRAKQRNDIPARGDACSLSLSFSRTRNRVRVVHAYGLRDNSSK